MDDTREASGLLRRGWLRLLDGERSWGSIDIRPDRFGVTHYRLVVYPPGISESERRWVRVARGWPLLGAVVWIISEIVFSPVTGPWTALAVSTGAYVGPGLVAVALAGVPRTRVRTMAVTVMAGNRDPILGAVRDRLEGLATLLLEADDRLADGRITAIQHEMVCWQVYDRMSRRAAPGMHPSDRGA